jgi:tetratricopeptide (TPR) repeat protein
MKFSKLILAASVVMLFTMTACEKFLERPVEGQLTEEEALQTEADLLAFMNGVNTLVADNDFMGGRVQIMNELLGDHLRGDRLTGDYAEIYRRQNSFFGGTRDELYKKGYAIVNRSNVALRKLDLATSQRNYVEGQAKFFRGLAHFELVRLFGQPWGYNAENSQLGIPLRTETGSASLMRATVKQVYDQVLADLKAADTLLPANAPDGKYFTPTKWAAKAYLAKVYFQMNDFANAYKYADEVISSNRFTLDATHNNRYSPGLSTEGIYVINDNPGIGYNPGGELRGNFRSNFNTPTLHYTDQFYNVANARGTDVRKAWYSNTLQTGFNVLTKYNKDFWDLPIVHLTEIKLIRAEAGAEIAASNAGALAKAITDINDIMTRAYGGTMHNLPSSSAASTVIATARAERELELVGEGNRVQEIKRIGARTGLNIDRRGSQWNCNGLLLQFPKTESDANAAFQMNPEGGCF